MGPTGRLAKAKHVALTLLILAAAGAPQLAAQPIVSDFSVDADGWTIENNSTSTTPDYNAAGGNPGGYISDVDLVAGAWNFVAPAKFLGNQSAKFAEMICFDRIQNFTANTATTDSVILEGGGVSLRQNSVPLPTTSWGTQCVTVDTTGGWINNATGLAATVGNFTTVLANMTKLAIRGDFYSLLETTGLDNTTFTPVELQSFSIE